MNRPDNEREFVNKVRQALDAETESLDAGLRSRLSQIRHRALDAGSHKPRFRLTWVPLPAIGLAAAVAVLALALFFKSSQNLPADLEDIDLLASQDQFELYEGLEFYAWLAEEEPHAG